MSHLHHELVTAEGAKPVRWALVLHGIFGSGKNWLPVMRKVVERRPEWGAALVDLREHGRSLHMSGAFTLEAAAEDLVRLAHRDALHVEAVIGHSFGGKVALTFARRNPPGLRSVFVIDSALDAIDRETEPRGDGWMMLSLLRRLPGPFANRDDAVGALTSFGVSSGVAQWMAMNLERRGESYLWRMNLDRIESLLRDYYAAGVWDVVENPPGEQRIHVIKATGSDHITAAACQRIDRAAHATGRVQLHRMQGGHWLNVENPAGVVETLVQGL